MEIIDLSPQEYQRIFPTPQHVYNSAAFIALNAHKVRRVHYLCIADSKPRIGLIVGEGPEGQLSAPFSAPFSGFDFNRRQSAETMLEAACLLRASYPGLQLTLPPAPYQPDINFRTQCAFLTAGASLSADWNFHIPLTENYVDRLSSSARNKLNNARRSPYKTTLCNDTPLRAYRVIQANRQQRGYPLRMSYQDIIATTQGPHPVIKADFFILTDGQTDAAAAMVYHISPHIRQVIYWGDDDKVTGCPNPMNLLAHDIVTFYQTAGVTILDIGPSSSNGIPSPGLCEFKDNIGCVVSPKPTLTL